jgi:hypothetical protein
MQLVETVKVEGLTVEPKDDDNLLVEGYVGVYSDYEGCTSMVYIKGIIEVSIKEDRISYILSDNLELISSEYDGVLWEDIIMELEDTLRTCYKVINED